VAIPAAESQAVYVVFVAEGYRLLPSNTHVGRVPGPIDPSPYNKQNSDNDKGPDDARAGKHLHAGMKNLRHLPSHPFTAMERSPVINRQIRSSEQSGDNDFLRWESEKARVCLSHTPAIPAKAGVKRLAQYNV
jgi:hypothetical protein